MSQTSTVVPLRLLHEGLGTLLIGTWFNAALFAFELTQVYHYFAQHPLFSTRASTRAGFTANGRRLDHLWIRILVLWMLALDLIATFAACALAYAYTVTGWGDFTQMQANTSSLSTYCVCAALSMFTLHMFLIFRYYRLSHYTVFSTLLSLLALTACALDTEVSIAVLTVDSQVSDRVNLRTRVIICTTATASTGWIIGGALMWLLACIRTTIDDTKGLIARLIHNSFLSGFGPGILTLICLIGFLCSPSTNFSLMFSLCFGRAATLTVVYNLNLRASLASTTGNASDQGTVQPRQLFGGTVDRRPPDETCHHLPVRRLGGAPKSLGITISRTAEDHGIVVESDLDSKPTFDLEMAAQPRESHANAVRVSFSMNQSCLKSTPDLTRSVNTREVELKAEL